MPSREASAEEGPETQPEGAGDPPMLYASGFRLGFSNADMVMILNVAHRQMAEVHMSYTLAKTLVEKLGNLVADFEKATGKTLLTTDEVQEAMASSEVSGGEEEV